MGTVAEQDRWVEYEDCLIQIRERGENRLPDIFVRAGYIDGSYDAEVEAYVVDWDRGFSRIDERDEWLAGARRAWEGVREQ